FTGALTGAGTLTKNSLGTLHVTNVRTAGLNVSAGTVHILPSRANLAAPTGGNQPGSTSSLTSIPTIGGTSKLDIDDNSLVINYTGASPLAAVQTLLQNGRKAGGGVGTFGDATWNGLGGITSSAASTAAQGLSGLGNGVDPAIGYGEN